MDKKQTLILNCTQNLEYHLKSSEKVWTNLKALKDLTIHLRRPWTSAFFRLASGTVGFSPRLKNSGHVITFLRRCGLQNTDHVMPFWPLKVDSLSHVFPAFVKVQRKERCPLYKILSTLAGVYAQWTTPRTCIDYQLECMLLPLQFKLYMLELRGRS